MRRKLLSLLLACALAIGLSAPGLAAGGGETLPALGRTVHGFRVTDRGALDAAGAETVTLEHIKSGATVYFIASDDPNRAFDITFRTPALDDRGIPHVFEHVTISGSDKYPSPNLTFPVFNQTYNTFGNAFTYDNMTTYPLGSLSEDQLLKLMDYYMDGLFHPLIRTEERLFRREAWRYELLSADAPLTLTGTVYSEMKGSVDLAGQSSFNHEKTLFPGSIAGNNSGGDPARIPELTRQDLLDYHETYYHPSNSLIILYGELNLNRMLEWLDREYLSQFERKTIAVDDGAIAPLAAPVSGRYEYPVEVGSSSSAVADYGMAANGATGEERIALSVLAEILNHSASPVIRAIQTALPGASPFIFFDDTYAPYVTFGAAGVAEGGEQALKSAVDTALAGIVRDGLDREAAQAVIAGLQMDNFTRMERSNAGIYLALDVAQHWAGGQGLDWLNRYGAALEKLRDGLNSGYLEGVAAKYLIGNPHSALTLTVPVPGLREQEDAALAAELAAKKAAMTEAEIAALVQETADFTAWSTQAAPAGLVASLQALTVAELPEEVREIAVDEKAVAAVRSLAAEADVNGAGRTVIYLDLSGVSADMLPWVSLYAGLMGRLDTAQYTAAQAAGRVSRYLPGLAVVPNVVERRDGERLTLTLDWTSMTGEEQEGLDLLKELLLATDCTDTAALKTQVGLIRQNAELTAAAYPPGIQLNRAMARYGTAYAALNQMTGLEYAAFLKDVEALLESGPGRVTELLEAARALLHDKTGALDIYAGSGEAIRAHRANMERFWGDIPAGERPAADWGGLSVPAAREGVVMDTNIQYNLAGAGAEDCGIDGSGSDLVLSQVITDRYLFPTLRNDLGVYGPYFMVGEIGAFLTTYRDPNVKATYDVYDALPRWAETEELTQAEMDGYILKTYSSAALPSGPLAEGVNAAKYAERGRGTEDRLRLLREIKATTPADLKAMAPELKRLVEEGARSTVGGSAVLQANAGLFDTVFAPFGAAAPLTRGALAELLCGGVETTKAAGLLLGDGSGDLRTDEAVTREQLAVILWRLAGCPEAEPVPVISDGASLSPWAREAVNWAVADGRLSLDAGGEVRPDGTVTKADLGL